MDKLQEYLKKSRKIDGWFDPDAAKIIKFLSDFQSKKDILGNIFEIGVHHGKMTLLLGLCLKDKELILVNDIFEMQELNVSKSGLGSIDIFKKNFENFFGNTTSLKIFKKQSNLLTPKETTNTCRMFSIDGGHSAKETFDDLETSKKATIPEGIIIVDDYFNIGFPGVSEGTCTFLNQNKDIKPFMYFFNKLILLKKTEGILYEKMFHNEFKQFCERNRFVADKKIFFGQNILIISALTPIQKLILKLRKKIETTPLLPLFRKEPFRSIYELLFKPKL